MNVVRTDINAVNIVLSLKIEGNDYKDAVEKQLKEIRRKANVPGFRTGMVPMGMVKKMYGRSVKADEINKLMQKCLFEYIKENNLDVLGEPLPYAEDETAYDFDSDNEFEFKFELGLAPAEEPTLNKRDNLTVYKIIVTDEMVEEQVKNYCDRFGTNVDVEAAISENDLLKGNLREIGAEEPVEVENAVFSVRYMADDEQKKLFNEVKKGDKVVFNPKKAYTNVADLASMLKIDKEKAEQLTSDFEMEVTSISNFVPAELNEELFGKVYPGEEVKTEEEFRAKVRAGIEYAYKEDSDYKFGLDARKAMVKKMDKYEYPEDFLRRWLRATDEKYTDEMLDKEFPAMMEDMKWYIFKKKVATKNEIKVEADDIKAFARRMARMQFAQYGMTNVPDTYLDQFAESYLKKEETVNNIADKALEDKIFEYLKGVVKITETEISVEDFNKMFEPTV